MAAVTIHRRWPDDDQILVTIEVDDSHPDGLVEEVARVAVRTFADALDVTIAADVMDGDDETGESSGG